MSKIDEANAELDAIEAMAEQNKFDIAKGEARDWVKGKDLRELAVRLKEAIAEKERIEVLSKINNAWVDVLRMEAIPQKVDEMGLESPVKLEGIGRVSLTTDLLVSVKGGCKPKLLDWLRTNKFADLIKEEVNASTLKSFVKGRITSGNPYPDDLLNVTPVEKASVLK